MRRNRENSLELWRRYGRHLLMAVPYADSLIADGSGSVLRDLDGNGFSTFPLVSFARSSETATQSTSKE